MIGQINAGNPGIAPAFGQIMYATTVAGLAATFSNDLWGWSKDVQFYIRATTLRLTEAAEPSSPRAPTSARSSTTSPSGSTVAWSTTAPSDSSPSTAPSKSVAAASINHPRSRSTRQAPHHLGHAPAPRPSGMGHCHLAQRPRRPRTPGMFAFYREMEQWMRNHYNNNDATFRPEWSKGWAFAPTSRTPTPRSSPRASPRPTATASHSSDNWDTANAAFNALDPHKVFSNTFLDQLLP